MISGTLIILTSYIAATIGWRAWYYLFAGLSGCVLFLAIFFVPETKYIRPLTAYKGTTIENGNPSALIASSDPENPKQSDHVMTVNDERILDTVNYLPRTLKSNLQIFVNELDWSEAIHCLKHMFQLFFFPNVFWVFSMNGIFLGVNIAMGLTYGNILSGPFHWADKYISVAMAGQIVVAFLCVPMLGYGSDFIVKFMARRNCGVHEPEHRLLTLITPLLLGIMFVVIYGQAATFPERYHWMAIVFSINGCELPFANLHLYGLAPMMSCDRLFHFHRCQHCWHHLPSRRISNTSSIFTCRALRHAWRHQLLPQLWHRLPLLQIWLRRRLRTLWRNHWCVWGSRCPCLLYREANQEVC